MGKYPQTGRSEACQGVAREVDACCGEMNHHDRGPGSFVAYNLTRSCFLDVDVEVADFTPSSLECRLPSLAPQSRHAFWIVPFRGISPAHVQIPIDLLYLDKNQTIVEAIEFFPIGRVSSSSKPAASVLALPADTIAGYAMAAGDQLFICGAEEMKQRLRHVSARSPQASSGLLQAESKGKDAPQPKSWLQRLFSRGPRDLRRAPRTPIAGLVAYFFTGGMPVSHKIRDISAAGAYVLTDERWYLGTIVRMTLTDKRIATAERSITVHGKVVRWGNDGVGFEFLLDEVRQPSRRSASAHDVVGPMNRDAFQLFLDQMKDDR